MPGAAARRVGHLARDGSSNRIYGTYKRSNLDQATLLGAQVHRLHAFLINLDALVTFICTNAHKTPRHGRTYMLLDEQELTAGDHQWLGEQLGRERVDFAGRVPPADGEADTDDDAAL